MSIFGTLPECDGRGSGVSRFRPDLLPGYTLRMTVIRTVMLLLLLALCSGIATADSLQVQPAENARAEIETAAFPVHDEDHYTVKCLGITCGHLILSSSIVDFEGRPAYHIVMTGRNSKFFNRIYKINIRIDSWVDARTQSSLVYESVTTEKGETSTERHEINWDEGIVRSVEDGVEKTLEFSSAEPVLDPLAFIFRLQALAKVGGGEITLTLLTTRGPVQTIATVHEPKTKRTSRGRRLLLEIKPQPADGKMFSKKGQFSLWVDPQDSTTLYILDFKLPFGHLISRID